MMVPSASIRALVLKLLVVCVTTHNLHMGWHPIVLPPTMMCNYLAFNPMGWLPIVSTLQILMLLSLARFLTIRMVKLQILSQRNVFMGWHPIVTGMMCNKLLATLAGALQMATIVS